MSKEEMEDMAQKTLPYLKENPSVLKTVINDLRDKAYICCLNDNPLNLLMWSHYAQQHKGFLIEFRFSVDQMLKCNTLNEHFRPMPVTYEEYYPILHALDTSTDNVAIKGYLYKSKDWAYEREWRVVRCNIKSGSEIQKYPRDLVVTSVIAGVACEEQNIIKWISELEILSTQLERTIGMYRAETIKQEYALTVPNHPRLDVLANSKKKK